MAGFDYKEFVSDFSRRTFCNYETVKAFAESKEKNEPKKTYEVTQLINCLFGILILPQERYGFDHDHKDDTFSEEELSIVKGYDALKEFILKLDTNGRLYNDYKVDKYLVNNFLHHMRDSLAHSGDNGVRFTPIKKNKVIKSVLFHDSYKSQNFYAELRIGEIEELASILVSFYGNLEKEYKINDLERYDKEVAEYQSFLGTKPKWSEREDMFWYSEPKDDQKEFIEDGETSQ